MESRNAPRAKLADLVLRCTSLGTTLFTQDLGLFLEGVRGPGKVCGCIHPAGSGTGPRHSRD